MKKIFFYVVLLGMLASCAKILDKEPLDIITDGAVWNDEILIDAYLAQAYSECYVLTNEVPSNEQYFNDGWTAWSFINTISDEAKSQYSSWTWSWKNGGLRIHGGLLEWWEASYSVIRKLNELIERLPGSAISEEFKAKRIAEARFLRAFNYFSMVKRYGGVPLITKAQNIDDPIEELYPSRQSEQIIYDFVLSELDDIAKQLPARNERGRPGKYAALALQSRAALYAASIAQFGDIQLEGLLGIPQSLAKSYYQKAYDVSREIITEGGFSLYNKNPDKVLNFRNLFLVKNNSEVIFVRPYEPTDAQAGGNGWSYDFFQCPAPQGWGAGNQDGAYLEMVEEFEYVDGRPGTLNRELLEQNLWTTDELWQGKDPRFFATIYTQNSRWKGQLIDWHFGIVRQDGSIQIDGAYEGISAVGTQRISDATGSSTFFGVLKYLDESKDNFSNILATGTDWIVFRFGEVLLNYAEAAYALGSTGDAVWAINVIRERAGINDINSIDADIIRHERKVELAFEGHRYWDLRRWRTAEEELSRDFSGLRYILDYPTKKFKLQVLNKIDGESGPKFYPYNYYLPITLGRTGSNPNLIENPGYF